ncbi:MAG: glycosyltransferase family 4 protein [Acidobacteriota bacterium]
MKILSITAGAAGMYCGSCLRDNALAVELLARGHDVTLLPLYTPTLTDEANVSHRQVLFGGISVYLQQHLALFRRTPRFLDRLWDSPRVIGAFASRSIATDPALLGSLTVSMLEGRRGVLRKEFDKLLEWLAAEPAPDVVNLPNSLLIGLAAPLREVLKRPICCTLQGEDLFLQGLIEPYRRQAFELIQQQVRNVDRFIAVSEYYEPVMSGLLGIPADRITVVPLGINLAGYGSGGTGRDHGGEFRVGFFARVAPEKGLQQLADAYVQFRRRTAGAPVRLEAAGYLSRAHEPYLETVKQTLERAGLGREFTYRGTVDRDGKLAFLRSLDVLSVPATYDEPKGVFLLEAMASGVPVVQPRRGAFTEIVTRTGGGLLVAPGDPAALADGLYQLWQDRPLAAALGARGAAGVAAYYGIARSTDRLLELYRSMLPAVDRDVPVHESAVG